MTQQSDPAQAFGLGAIDQISFAVTDMDEALPRYTAMFGPFTSFEVPDLEAIVHGEPTKTTLKLGFGRTGDVEVELVEVRNGSWPTVAWLEERGEGLHHVRYPVDDLEATRDEMVSAGFVVTLESADRKSFAYLESPMLNGMTVELICMPRKES